MTLLDDNRGSRTRSVEGQSPVVVTDHAVLRYLERAHGLNIAQLRDHIAGLCTNGARLRARAVIVENVKFMLAGEKVVTVLEREWIGFDPNERRREVEE